MVVTFTLQNQYSGTTYVAGPFNISGTTSGNITTELATGVTKAELLTGYTISGLSDLTTGGTIASTGVCTTTQQWQAYPSATPTPTTTSSLPQTYSFYISNSSTQDNGHCNQNQLMTMEILSTSNTIPFMLNTIIYDTNGDPFNGNGLYYAVSVTSGDNTNNQPYQVILVNSAGEVTNVVTISDCSGPGNSV